MTEYLIRCTSCEWATRTKLSLPPPESLNAKLDNSLLSVILVSHHNATRQNPKILGLDYVGSQRVYGHSRFKILQEDEQEVGGITVHDDQPLIRSYL